MPTFLKISFSECQSFIWNDTYNGEKVSAKEKTKLLSKIAIGKLNPMTKELVIDDVMVGAFTIRTPRYTIVVNHVNVENADHFSASINNNQFLVEGFLVVKVTLKDDALADLKANLSKVHISEFSIWNPEEPTVKNFYKFTKTGDWKDDARKEQEIFEGKEVPARKLLIEVSSSKFKIK